VGVQRPHKHGDKENRSTGPTNRTRHVRTVSYHHHHQKQKLVGRSIKIYCWLQQNYASYINNSPLSVHWISVVCPFVCFCLTTRIGLAFDPLEENSSEPFLYFTSNEFYHKESTSWLGLAISGRVSREKVTCGCGSIVRRRCSWRRRLLRSSFQRRRGRNSYNTNVRCNNNPYHRNTANQILGNRSTKMWRWVSRCSVLSRFEQFRG
jgi:hypothetical protein